MSCRESELPSRSHPLTFLILVSAAVLGILTAAPVPPVFANIQPEAILYCHVRPLGDPALYCTTNITECGQMTNSTPLQGPVEFQIFIDPLVDLHGDIPVTNFTAGVTWPDEWQLVDAAYCRDGYGTIDAGGSNPHDLVIDWDCAPMTGMFLAATLVLNVTGHGYLAFSDPVSMWLGCPPEGGPVVPVRAYAEAGTDCEYTNNPCHGAICYASFHQDELTLTTTVDGTAHGELEFDASHGMPPYEQGCHGYFQAETDATWLTPHIEDGLEYWENWLILDADASGLAPGEYQTWTKVYTSATARCVSIILDVQGGTPAHSATWGRVKALYR